MIDGDGRRGHRRMHQTRFAVDPKMGLLPEVPSSPLRVECVSGRRVFALFFIGEGAVINVASTKVGLGRNSSLSLGSALIVL